MYFIDKLALRAGNEKDTDEAADTVGCCSLRVEHVKVNKAPHILTEKVQNSEKSSNLKKKFKLKTILKKVQNLTKTFKLKTTVKKFKI